MLKEKETIGEHMKFGDLKLNQTDYKQLMLLAKIKNFERNHLFWLYYVKNFGLKQASKFGEYRKDRIIWLKMCEDWLIKNFSALVQEYKNVDVEFERAKALSNRTNHIWVCWLQGEENMPEIVKLCINSIRMHSPAHAEVTLITAKNLDQYLEFPDYVLKKVKEGKLSLTHFSDIVRFSLLEKYGGLWMDATMFLTDDIPDDIFQKPLWGIQLFNSMERKENPYYGCISTFLVGGGCGHPLFSFCKSLFCEYVRTYDAVIDVHWINLAFAIAYHNFKLTREDIESIGVSNTRINELVKLTNNRFEEIKWNSLVEEQKFHKMNWRLSYSTEINGYKTYYSYMKESVK